MKLRKKQISMVNEILGSYEALSETLEGLEKGWEPNLGVSNEENCGEYAGVSIEPKIARNALEAQRQQLVQCLEDIGIDIEDL